MTQNKDAVPDVTVKQSGHEEAPGKTSNLSCARSFGPASFLLLGAFFLARAALCPLLPCETWGVSAYHCATPYLNIPLNRSHICVAEKAFGEGARFTNRLDFVSYRSERFTVDERGHRNLPGPQKIQPRVILSGSSFSLGVSLNDEETLSAQLNQLLGPIVYNAATIRGYDDLPLETLKRISHDMRMSQGWILLEINNRGPYEYVAQPSRKQSGFLAGYQEQVTEEDFRRWKAPAQSIYRRVVYCIAQRRISALVNMRLHNDRWLPNPFKNGFAEEELVSGRHMLFHAGDKEFFLNPAKPDATATAISQFRDDLSEAGLNLAVLLVPTGYTVYYPLLRKTEGSDAGAQYLSELAMKLEGKGIPAFSSLPSLREAASRELAADGLVYWPDDSHWNAQGCATAARGAAPWLRALISNQSPRGQEASGNHGNSVHALQ